MYGNQITGRIPLLLPCSHTICDCCIKSARKAETFRCRVCEFEISVDESQPIHNILPIDHYLYGAILNTTAEPKISFMQWSPAGASFYPIKKKLVNRQDGKLLIYFCDSDLTDIFLVYVMIATVLSEDLRDSCADNLISFSRRYCHQNPLLPKKLRAFCNIVLYRMPSGIL